MSVWAVLAAAGRGERLGSDRPKAFAKLGDRPLLAESLERLEATKVVACATGGETRADSVRAGVAEVSGDATVIVVHDAARPVLPEEVLARVLTALNEGWDGVVPGMPIADTVKRVEGALIVETLPREELVAAQTPQAFLAPILRDALTGDLARATDCSALVEKRGGRVTMVPGDPRLLKVTDSADLELVGGWL